MDLDYKAYQVGEKKPKTNSKIMLINNAIVPYADQRGHGNNNKQIDLSKVSGYLWTPTNLYLVASSKEDNVKSDGLHEE